MKSRENVSCERATDSHCIKPQVPSLSQSALLHRPCSKSEGVKDSKSVNNLIEPVEPTPTNIVVHQEKHKRKVEQALNNRFTLLAEL